MSLLTFLRLVVLCAPLAAVSATLRAQPLPPLDDVQVRVFTAADGLIGADVRGLVQGHDGYIYVSNPRGVTRFNGHTFQRVPLSGLSDGFIESIMLDAQGRLWVRTDHGAIGYFKNDAFQLLPPTPTAFSSWSLTTDGLLWLGGDNGVIRVDAAAPSPYTYFDLSDGFPGLRVTGVYDLPDGERVVVASNRLLRMLDDRTATHGVRFTAVGPAFQDATEAGHEVRVDPRGLWFSTNSTDRIVNYRAGRFEYYGHETGLPALDVDSLAWHDGSSPLVQHSLARSLRMTAHAGTRIPATHRLTHALRGRQAFWYALSDSLDHDPVLVRRRGAVADIMKLQSQLVFSRLHHLLEDREGSLWIGTDRGLLQLAPRQLFSLTTADGLSEAFTTAVRQTRDGALWIGTFGGGLQKFSMGRLMRTFTRADGLPFNQIRALHEARDGRVWVGTSLGYAIIDADRVVRSVPSREVRGFAESDDGIVWIGTETALLQDRAGQVTSVDPDYWRDQKIWAVHRARDGSVWVGGERGLHRFRAGTMHRYGAEAGLRSGFVVSIAEEADGTLWFGTYDHGLHRYRGAAFVAVTSAHGLHNNGVWRMVFDTMGGVWMSSDQGLFRVDHRELHRVADGIERDHGGTVPLKPMVFTESEGMPSRESNRASPGGWRLQDGRIVFNNIAGAIVIDPSRVMQGRDAPRAVIERVTADGTALPLRAVQVSSRIRQLSFDFAALSFLAPEQNHFRYRLDGYDVGWVDGGTVRRATYTNLPPGEFTFRVQGATGTGDWRGAEAAMSVAVAPQLWQTLAFRLFLAMLVVTVLVIAYRLRVDRLLAMERLRMRIAADLHDDIGSSLSSIALLSEMLKDTGRLDVQEQRQLHRINAAATETVGALREIIWLVDPRNGTLADLVRRMHLIAEGLLGARRWTVSADAASGATVLGITTMRNALLVCKEALHNIQKHSAAGEVVVQLSARNRRLTLTIADDGSGFDPSAPQAGNGLANMRRRAEQIGGTFAVESGTGRGTRLTWSVPLT